MASEQREQLGYELSVLANAAVHHLTAEQVDQLKLKVSRAFADLERQLAEARAENERLKARDEEWTESQAQAVTRYAQACALLEEIARDTLDEVTLDSTSYEWRQKALTFLAEHLAP